MGTRVNVVVLNVETAQSITLYVNSHRYDAEKVVRDIASASRGETAFVNKLLNYGGFWIDLEPFGDYEYILCIPIRSGEDYFRQVSESGLIVDKHESLDAMMEHNIAKYGM